MLLRLALPIVLAASVLVAAPGSIAVTAVASAEEVAPSQGEATSASASASATSNVNEAPSPSEAPTQDSPDHSEAASHDEAPTAETAPTHDHEAAAGPTTVTGAPTSAPKAELTGTIEVVEADATLNPDGTTTAPAVHEVAFVLTDTGERVELAGKLPEGTVSGATFEGTVALPKTATDELSAATLAAASTNPLDGKQAEQVLASATTEQVALPVVTATITPAAAELATPGAHSLYVAIVRPKGSTIMTSTISSTYLSRVISRVSKYWVGQSGGAITKISTAKVIRTASNYSCANGVTSVSGMWNEAAAKFSKDPNTFFGADSRRHLVVLTPDGTTSNGPCARQLGFSGLGTVGSSSADGGKIHSTIGSKLSAPTLAHEFGHNMGLGHANVALCASSTIVEAPGSGCVINEYYDLYDVMGATVVGQTGLPSLSLPAKERLGFIAESDVVTAALDGSSEASFTETIHPISTTTGVRGFAVTDPTNGDAYWVELRTTSGQDVNLLANRDTFSMCVNTCPSWKFSFGDGVRILKIDEDNPRETLVVAAPATIKRGIKTRDLALDSLDSFSSRSGGVHVDVNWATGRAASVTVRLTATPTLLPSAKGNLVRGWAGLGQALIAPEQYFRQPAAALTRQWLRDGEPIVGAVGSTYLASADDVGRSISVVTTGTLNGSVAQATSAPIQIGLVAKPAVAQQPLTIVKPEPAGVAGDARTPKVILYSDEYQVAGTPSLAWVDPVQTRVAARAFDEDGISLTSIPWIVGAQEQSITGAIAGRPASEPVEFTPDKATPVVRLTLSTSKATTTSTVKAYVTFEAMTWYSHPPTGTVTIYSDGEVIASKQLSSAKATILLPAFVTPGTKSLRVVYEGDAHFNTDASVVRKLYVS